MRGVHAEGVHLSTTRDCTSVTLAVGPPRTTQVGDVFVDEYPDRLEWTCSMHAVDADGAFNAYGPPGTKHLDVIDNAGKPGDFYGIATTLPDGKGDPIIQGPDDPCPGCYVSTTAYQDHTKKTSDPTRYVNAAEVAYVVITSALEHLGARPGDVGECLDEATGKYAVFVAGDVGPHLGEVSIKLADIFGVPSSPRTGGDSKRKFKFTLFLKSSKPWPRTQDEINEQVQGFYADNNLTS